MTNTSTITSYERFCMNMHNALKKKSKEGSTVHLQTVRKNNGVILRGITITNSNGNIMPTVYLDKFFCMYEEGTAFEEVVTFFLREYEKAGVEGDFDIQFFSVFSTESIIKVRSRLYSGYKGANLIYRITNRVIVNAMDNPVPMIYMPENNLFWSIIIHACLRYKVILFMGILIID